VQKIKDAITLLVLKTVKSIVMLQSKKYISRNLVYSDIFKKHLLELPILCALIAFDLSVPLGLKSLREELFLLAMMCKIGMTILALNSPKIYTEILTQYESIASDLFKIEKDEFGLNHVEVGMYIFNVWQMPPIFLRMMKNQIFTMEEFGRVDDFDRILRLANVIGRKVLKIPLLDSELEMVQLILAYYKAPEELMDLFDEDYYIAIKSHPFFDAIT
jgi:HD-like signal output (HDOD) protein